MKVPLTAVLIVGCAGRAPARPAIAPTEPPTTGPRIPLAAWFGGWDEGGTFERRSRLPKVAGQSYGWRIKTRCTGPARFREVLRLPAPGEWTFTPEELPGTTVSDDRTTTTTIDYAACEQGWIEHVWTVTEGDPVGTYVITVEVEGYQPQTFRPKFVAP